MLLNRTPDEIVDSWLAERDRALEAGERLLLQAGGDGNLLAGVASLYAYETYLSLRSAGQTPLISAGGDPWLLALLHLPPFPASDPTPTIGYAGPDAATAIAAVNGYDQGLMRPSTRRLFLPPGGLEPGFHPHILPDATPGRPIRWVALPLALDGAAPVAADMGLTDASSTRKDARCEPNWAGVAALLLAVSLVLLSLLI